MAISRRMSSLTRGRTGDMRSLFALARAGPEVSGLLLPRDPERPPGLPSSRSTLPAARSVAGAAPRFPAFHRKGKAATPAGPSSSLTKEVTGPRSCGASAGQKAPSFVIETTWADGLQGSRKREKDREHTRAC